MSNGENFNIVSTLNSAEVCEVLLRARGLVSLVLELKRNTDIIIKGKECLILDIGKREITYVEHEDINAESKKIDLLDFIHAAKFVYPEQHLEEQRKKISELINGVFQDSDDENEIIIDNSGLSQLCGIMVSNGISIPLDIFVKIMNASNIKEHGDNNDNNRTTK